MLSLPPPPSSSASSVPPASTQLEGTPEAELTTERPPLEGTPEKDGPATEEVDGGKAKEGGAGGKVQEPQRQLAMSLPGRGGGFKQVQKEARELVWPEEEHMRAMEAFTDDLEEFLFECKDEDLPEWKMQDIAKTIQPIHQQIRTELEKAARGENIVFEKEVDSDAEDEDSPDDDKVKKKSGGSGERRGPKG
ncbi:hypothetical protein T484DRAFT_1856688 [Baffinella frigidus]|nr:hypothetical protein T484DRAFT_1856688 [Cryptophyta sp. CCMP2293]